MATQKDRAFIVFEKIRIEVLSGADAKAFEMLLALIKNEIKHAEIKVKANGRE